MPDRLRVRALKAGARNHQPGKHFHYVRPWLYPKQLEAIFEPKDLLGGVSRYALIEAGTKTGKTTACIVWLFEQAFRGKRGQNFWWVAPVFGQALIAFKRMKAMLPQEVYDSREQPPTITLPNGAVVWFKSADDPDGLYGEDVFAVVLDEASRMREESMVAVRSTLTATQGPMRIIGNVKGRRNWFYGMCRKAEAGEPNMSYRKLTYLDAVEAGIFPEAEAEDARRLLKDDVFRELYLAEASDDGGNPFGIAAIAACVGPLSTKPAKAWGWDLAKSVDWTVGVALDEDGAQCRPLARFQKPWPDTIAEIVRLTGRDPALVDSTGVGDAVLASLQADARSNFEGYHFTAPSKQTLMEGLSVDIQSGAFRFVDGPMRVELEAFEYVYTRGGVRYGAPAGYHDDCVCAGALAALHRKRNKGAALWAKLGATNSPGAQLRR